VKETEEESQDLIDLYLNENQKELSQKNNRNNYSTPRQKAPLLFIYQSRDFRYFSESEHLL